MHIAWLLQQKRHIKADISPRKRVLARLIRMIRRHLPETRFRRQASKYLIGGKYHRIYHYHVRKTAGTSLDAAFWQLADVGPHEFGRRSRIYKNGLIIVRGDKKKIEDGHYFYASSHIPAYLLNLPKNTFTLTILRNPLNRLISYYRYLLWASNDPQAHDKEPFLEELQPEIGCLGSSFVDFLDRTPTRDLMAQLSMFSGNYDIFEAKERILACSMVGLTERFDRTLKHISERLELVLHIRNERRFAYPLSLSPGDLRRAREMLDPEFKLIEMVRPNL